MGASPSAAAVPGSGILGIVVCTVRFVGSYTKSYIGCELSTAVVLVGALASRRRSVTLIGDVEVNNGRCNGPN